MIPRTTAMETIAATQQLYPMGVTNSGPESGLALHEHCSRTLGRNGRISFAIHECVAVRADSSGFFVAFVEKDLAALHDVTDGSTWCLDLPRRDAT